jgi:RNA polymerase sigma-70 factor (ECF subfamily)
VTERSTGTADVRLLFTRAYRELSPAVVGYLRARGVDDPEAVSQDVFLALYPRLGALHGGAEGLRTLVFSIAHARVVDHHRSRTRNPLAVEYDPDQDGRTSPSAEEHALGGGSGIVSLLTTLNPEHREVLALRIVADLSLEITAEIMGRTPGAIKQLQRRALLALREVAVPAGSLV